MKFIGCLRPQETTTRELHKSTSVNLKKLKELDYEAKPKAGAKDLSKNLIH